MKKHALLICGGLFALLVFLAPVATSRAEEGVVRFTVDATQRGKTIGNKVSTVNLWQLQGFSAPTKDEGANLSEFVEHVQFMQATGGNESRDLFVDPKNCDVVDDYAFDSMISACKTVLSLGAKPHIKLSVPDKFSKETVIGDFRVDALPPDDYEVYYRYIRALAQTLVDEFGLDEVRTWGWGVLVEFENASWFHSKDKTPEGSRDAYFKLYDYSVAALTDVLGANVYVGAHAMACTEGLWDERDLLDHCAKDVNAKTGQVGTSIKYFAVSFYDDLPNSPHPLTLQETIRRIRERAESVGLTDLRYGVDEGRILASVKGKDAGDLVHRIVGQTYQAAYDTRLFKIMVDSDVDYFSAWSYSSASPWQGYPLIAFRAAQGIAKFKNAKNLAVEAEKKLDEGVDCDAVAGFDEETETLYLTSYNFKFDLEYAEKVDVNFAVAAPFWKGKKVEIVETVIDDEANFFCEWLKDKEKHAIPNEAFHWSPDSGCLDVGFSDQKIRDFYFKELRPKYLEIARRPPRSSSSVVEVAEDGTLNCGTKLARHAVVFYVIRPVVE